MRKLMGGLLVVTLLATPAWAAPPVGKALDRIRASGTIQVGYRAGAVPFSYVDEQGRVLGYAIDLCRPVLAAIQNQLGLRSLKVSYTPTTPSDRMEKIRSGQIDLECAITTNTRDRRQQVSFGLPYYFAAVRLLASTTSGARSLNDLHDLQKPIAIIKGSTAERIIHKRAEHGLQDKTVPVDSVVDAHALLEKGSVAGVLYDDVVLARYAMQSGGRFALVGPRLSIEPLAPMFALGDPAMQELVVQTMSETYRSGAARAAYNKWFTQPIPALSLNLNLPVSPLLAESFRNPSARIPEWSEL